MNDSAETPEKRRPQKAYLVAGIMWLALGLFGLAFDPEKHLMIAIQLAVGSGILIYYFWSRSR